MFFCLEVEITPKRSCKDVSTSTQGMQVPSTPTNYAGGNPMTNGTLRALLYLNNFLNLHLHNLVKGNEI